MDVTYDDTTSASRQRADGETVTAAPASLAGSLHVSADAVSGALQCPGDPLALTGASLDANEEVTFTLTCTYTGLNDGAKALVRGRDAVDVIGAVLAAKSGSLKSGIGHRGIAARLGEPATTVRG